MSTPQHGNDPDNQGAQNRDATDPAGTPTPGPENLSPYGTAWQTPEDGPNQYSGYNGYSSYAPGQPGYSPAPGGYPPYAPPAAEQPKPRNKGFVGALLDLNFNHFVSVKFAKVIYLLALSLALVVMLFGWLIPALLAFGEGFFRGLFVLVIGWIPVGLVTLLALILIRVLLEFVIASVKTSENTSALVEQGEKSRREE